MGFFSPLFAQSANPSETIRRFEEELALHGDQLFGITLFFQGLEVMHSGQPEILEMNRQSFQSGKGEWEHPLT